MQQFKARIIGAVVAAGVSTVRIFLTVDDAWPTFFMTKNLLLFFLTTLFFTIQAQTTDPAKIADFQQRFKKGVELSNQGLFTEALKVFEGVLAEEPKARGSLFMAALCYAELNNYAKAIELMDRFRQLEPNDHKAIIWLIQFNQALKRAPRVESLRKELFALHKNGIEMQGKDGIKYVREKIKGDQGRLTVVYEHFDHLKEPFLVWSVEELSADDKILRFLAFGYDAEATKKLLEKNPKLQGTEVFGFVENVIIDGKIRQVNIYKQEFKKPAYEAFREWALAALKEPPKPISVTPIPAS